MITGRRAKYLVVLVAVLVAGGLASQAGNVVLTSGSVSSRLVHNADSPVLIVRPGS